MSIRNTTPDEDGWDRFSASDETNSVVIEQFEGKDPTVWVYTSSDCEKYSIDELVEIAGLDD